MRKKRKIREGNPIATILIYIAVGLLAFVCVYPMYFVLMLSLSEPRSAIAMNTYLLPKGFSTIAYETIVKDKELWRGFANSILYAAGSTVLMLITSALAAYGLGYRQLIGRKFITLFLLIPMYFGGGMVPSYLLMTSLGLYGSPLSQIIPAGFSIWNIILVRSYFRTIPEGLQEAARIDGAGVLKVLLAIIVPLAKPIFAVIAVYTIVGSWNSWFGAMLYLPDVKWQPLQMFLKRILVQNTLSIDRMVSAEAAKLQAIKELSNVQIKYAIIIFTSLPVLATYPFFQKYFVKGMVLGSLME